jgi:hypothetical protein
MRLWARRSRQPPSQPAPVPVPTTLPPERGLFIIGAARTGTTILQNALNHSPAIFLLGEPNLHLETGEDNFSARYNAMHRSWSNQKTKSTFCPPILPADGSAEDYLNRLSQTYTWVGSKIVMNNRRDQDWVRRLSAYHCQNFYTARYIFTFRDPIAAVKSTRGLQMLGGTEVDSPFNLLANYLETVELFVDAIRNLPHVRAVFHEDMGAEQFQSIGSWLNVDLSTSQAYYDQARIRPHDGNGFGDGDDERLEKVMQLYADLRFEMNAGPTIPQIEQNDSNFSPGHYTLLGSIARRAAVLSASFRSR